MLPVIFTTIQAPTSALEAFAAEPGVRCFVAGDRKTPGAEHFDPRRYEFLPYGSQEHLGFSLARHLPANHYVRKNLAYLAALRGNPEALAESDDDNAPLPGWRASLDVRSDTPGLRQLEGPHIANLYRAYSREHLWPRGLPIDRLKGSDDLRFAPAPDGAPILCCQGLANGAPDIDAIHRLVYPDREFTFDPGAPIVLGPGVWCPTNSQNTLWRRPAFPFLYLPHTVSFRFTDILRGYVALRGILALGGRLAFSGASVVQARNPHRILRDFEQEIEVYLRTGEVIDLLEATPLAGDAGTDLRSMYARLATAGVVRPEELTAVDAWLQDLRAIGS